jgi:hypothetical protein
MLTTVDFNFADSKSGKITYNPPSSYAAATGWANCQTGQNQQTDENQRAFFSFDTSSLPDHAQIEKVEFLIYVPKLPAIDPIVYRVGISIGTFIGAALDGTSDEWTGGAYMVTLYSRPASGTVVDLGATGNNPGVHVNRTGDTDIKVWDYSIGDFEHWFWMTSFNTSRDKCKLRITYSLPSATVTGRGDTSASAEIVLPAAGVATGTGSVQAIASLVGTGSAEVTGRGAAEIATGLILPAVALATGHGTSVAAAGQILSGVALAIGYGSSQATAITISQASSVATGRGSSSAAARLALPVELTATGIGATQAAAVVDLTGSGIASGFGSAELVALLDASVGAVATGHGYAGCSLGLGYTAPPARHLATRSVRAGHSATRSVAWVHTGTRKARRPS